MRAVVLALLLLAGSLAVGSEALAHAPATAIGRAVTALVDVPVSFDPASVVSDVEAANFSQVVAGRPVAVAFLPASTNEEIQGGPNAIAREIALEAELDTTLVVLVGTRLGAWSDDIGEERLAELIRETDTLHRGEPPAARVDALVNTVAAEPTGGGVPWVWIGVAAGALAVGALVVGDLRARRRP